MSSPFAVLRRNQKVLLAVFGVIIMIVFVVGSAFDDLFQGGGDDTAAATVVRWKYGNLSQMDLAVMRHRNNVMAHFLDEVMKRARERKGTPKVAALRRAESELELVRRMVLARKAKDSGIVISDEAVLYYLRQLSDEKLSDRDYSEIITSIPNRRIGEQQIFEELRLQLAADNQTRMMALWGWNTMTPASAWELYNRVHHRVQAEVLPLNVDDYRDQVADPSDAELKAFFDEHKNNYSHPDFPNPGFRQRPQAAFEYVKIEFEKFVDQEKAKLTDDELKAEYDTRVKRGEFKVPELPSAPNKPSAEKPVDPAESPDEKPEDKPAEKTVDKPSDKPADAKPEDKPGEKPADKPTDEKPATEKPTEKPDSPKIDKPAEKPAADPKPGDKPSETDPPACQDKPADKSDEKPTDKPADMPEDKPADKPTDKSTDKPADKSSDKPEDKPADKPGDKPTDKPEDKPAEKPEENPAEKPADEPKPKFRAFEEVRDELALSLARPRAQQAFEKVKTAARKELESAAREIRVALALKDKVGALKDKGGSEGELPSPPDAKAIASRFSLTYGNTPLVDALGVIEYELGQGSLMSFVGGFQQISFNQIAFRDELPLYAIEEIPGGDPNVTFLYWKTEQKPTRVPELKEVREQVVAIWKRRKALDIAKADAEAKVKDAKGKESLKEVFGDKVAETNMFSWVTSGAVGFGMGMPSLSRVENVDTPGVGFMEGIFAIKLGDVGVAVNHPETKVYVVRIAREGLNEEVRRTQFIQSGMTRDVSMLSFEDGRQGLETWMADLEKEMKVEWVAAADSTQSNEE